MDNKYLFELLFNITNELKQKLEARFELVADPSTKDLESYSSISGELSGSLKIFSGSEINCLVHQWARQPKTGFNYTRLVIWLGSQIRVPHLAFEFGGFEQLLFYIDYIPRTDLSCNLEYLDKFYEPVNQTYFNFQADSRFQSFVSKSPYIRQVFSPTCLCFTCPTEEETPCFIAQY